MMIPIKGFEDYLVCKTGDVTSKRFPTRFLKKHNCHKYYVAVLCKNGKQYTKKIHKLVADAFIPNPLGLSDINHIDGNKHNNNVDNLERCTHKENMQHATKMGLNKTKPMQEANKKPIHVIYKNKHYDFESIMEASDFFGISFQNISRYLKKQRKSRYGLECYYKEEWDEQIQ